MSSETFRNRHNPDNREPEKDALEQALSRIEWKDIAATKSEYEQYRDAHEDPDEYERISAVVDLLSLLLQAKNGSFRMDNAVRKIDDLRIGYEYVRRMGISNDRVRLLLEQLFQRVDTEAKRNREWKDDRKAEETARSAEQTEANDVRDALLLKDIHENGRSYINTSISQEFSRARDIWHGGFQTVRDPRESGRVHRVGMEVENAFGGGGRCRYMLEKQGIQLAVTAEPVTEDMPIFETPPAPTGFFAKMFAGTPESKQVGTRKEPVALSRFKEAMQGAEQAYRISIIIVGSAEKNNGYRDPDTGRYGNQICGGIYVPKDIAERTMKRIQQDPAFVRQLLRTFDPEMMKEQEPNMPEIDKAFVLPIGQADQAYEKDDRGMERSIRETFIKTGSF